VNKEGQCGGCRNVAGPLTGQTLPVDADGPVQLASLNYGLSLSKCRACDTGCDPKPMECGIVSQEPNESADPAALATYRARENHLFQPHRARQLPPKRAAFIPPHPCPQIQIRPPAAAPILAPRLLPPAAPLVLPASRSVSEAAGSHGNQRGGNGGA
jgi:hypothetical protein